MTVKLLEEPVLTFKYTELCQASQFSRSQSSGYYIGHGWGEAMNEEMCFDALVKLNGRPSVKKV